MSKQQLLDRIAADILSQNICPDLAKDATQLVFGEGNPDADIVLIGEAPGKKEDETGRPFVGRSGQFLDEMLGLAALKRKDVYITNIVKYRPPSNRDPSPAEKEAFAPFLTRQIEVLQPKVIITLGRHSGSFFLPELVISRDHGREQTITIGQVRTRIVPLYHPAVAIYNRKNKQILIDDFIAATT